MSATSLLVVFTTGFIGLHAGWFLLQEKYVPEEQRRLHPFQRLYRDYVKNKAN